MHEKTALPLIARVGLTSAAAAIVFAALSLLGGEPAHAGDASEPGAGPGMLGGAARIVEGVPNAPQSSVAQKRDTPQRPGAHQGVSTARPTVESTKRERRDTRPKPVLPPAAERIVEKATADRAVKRPGKPALQALAPASRGEGIAQPTVADLAEVLQLPAIADSSVGLVHRTSPALGNAVNNVLQQLQPARPLPILLPEVTAPPAPTPEPLPPALSVVAPVDNVHCFAPDGHSRSHLGVADPSDATAGPPGEARTRVAARSGSTLYPPAHGVPARDSGADATLRTSAGAADAGLPAACLPDPALHGVIVAGSEPICPAGRAPQPGTSPA